MARKITARSPRNPSNDGDDLFLSSSRKTVGGLRERRRIELVDIIRRIAMQHFRARGYDGTSLKGICDEAGISIRTLFRHFQSKDAILGYTVEKRYHQIVRRLSERPRGEAFLAAYRYALDDMVDEMIADPEEALLTERLLQEVPTIRAQFLIPSLTRQADDMDREMAQRFGLPIGDGRLGALRCFLVTAVMQAMMDWARDGAVTNLRDLIGEYVELLAPVVDRLAHQGKRPNHRT